MRRLFRPRASGSDLSEAAFTPMVDVLTIVLVVLLRSFSSDPPFQGPEAEGSFVLPVSHSEVDVDQGVSIQVGAKALYVDGYRAGSSEFWEQSQDVLIRDLYETLQGRGGTLVRVEADQDVPWSLVSKVLFTVQQAGYTDVELIATSNTSL